jgi:inorganic pyrophosphatase
LGDGDKVENDRLLAVGASSLLHEKVRKLADLPNAIVEQIEQFFVAYNRLDGGKFVVKDHHGPKRGRECVRRGKRRFAASKK